MNLVNRPRRSLKLFRDTRGANLVEYVILVGLVAILALFAFRFFGRSVSTKVAAQAGTVQNQVQSNAN